MYRTIGALAALTLLAGCQSVSIDLAHSRTSAGYINSALLDVGYLFLLDTTSGQERLTRLAIIPLVDKHTGKTFKSFTATGISGAGFGGSIDAAVKARVDAELKTAASVVLTNDQSVEYQGTYTAISAAINELSSAGVDVATAWQLGAASAPTSALRYVLAYGSHYADKAEFTIDNNVVGSGSLDVPTGRGGQFKVEIKGADSEKFEGEGIPVLMKYFVLKASVADNGSGALTYHFDQDYSFEMDRLPDMLRRSAL